MRGVINTEGKRINRREVLRAGALLAGGIGAAALLGCGEDDDAPSEQAVTPSPTASASTTDLPGDGSFPYNLPAASGDPKPGGTLMQGVTWNLGPMDPTKSAAGGTIAPARGAYNGLVRYVTGPAADPLNLEIEPELADSWEVSPDGLTYTFTLAEGVQWQNVPPVSGRPFTAEDAKFAWDRYAAGGWQAGYWVALDRIDVEGDATVVVKLKTPSPDFLIPIASRYLTMHPRELVDGGLIERQAIGTGPMIFREGNVDQNVVMERNPDYFRGPVPLAGVEFRIMPDLQSRLTAFRVGQLEHAQTILGGLRDLEQLMETNEDLQVTVSEPLFGPFQYTFNLENPKWQDVRVRRAIQMGMDRETMVQVIHEGNGAAVTAIPFPFLFDELPTSAADLGPWWAYQPDEAKQLLQAAGAEDWNFDCIWYSYTESGNAQPNAMAVDQLRQIGVTMTAQKLEYTQFNSQWTGVTYEDAVDGWSANGFAADTYFFEQLHSNSPNNRSRGLADTQVDEWGAAQSRELDPDARRELQRKIWDRVQDQVWRVDKPTGKGYEVLQPWLRDVSFTGPYNANYSFTEIAAPSQLERAWLDK